MKKIISILLVLMSFSLSANEKGNGGGLHFCPYDYYQELYDIYEGRERYGLKYPSFYQNESEQYILMEMVNKVEAINPVFSVYIQSQLDHIMSTGTLILKPVGELPFTHDANIISLENGCSYKQLANWNDKSNEVIVSQKLYRKMDNFNKAALLLHEAIYKLARMKVFHSTSDLARRLVAEIMSTNQYLPTLENFLTAQDKLPLSNFNILESEIDQKLKRISIIRADSCRGDLKISLINKNNYDVINNHFNFLSGTYLNDLPLKIEALSETYYYSLSERKNIKRVSFSSGKTTAGFSLKIMGCGKEKVIDYNHEHLLINDVTY